MQWGKGYPFARDNMRKFAYSWIGATLRRTFECRMCRHVGAYAVLSVLAIEGAILIPSYWNYDRAGRIPQRGVGAVGNWLGVATAESLA